MEPINLYLSLSFCYLLLIAVRQINMGYFITHQHLIHPEKVALKHIGECLYFKHRFVDLLRRLMKAVVLMSIPVCISGEVTQMMLVQIALFVLVPTVAIATYYGNMPKMRIPYQTLIFTAAMTYIYNVVVATINSPLFN